MPNISKPANINQIWSASGDILKPSDSKIAQGWAAEIPPRQWFNWDQNRKDQAIAHINQHGIPVWDNVTEYQANSSYVQGSNDYIYYCLFTNTNRDPVTDNTSSWKVVLNPTGQTGQVSFNANGYMKLDNGFILQWGIGVTASNGRFTASFPIAFPNACLRTYATNSAAGGTTPIGFGGTQKTNTTITVYSSSSSGTPSGANVTYDWLALGY